MTATNMTVAEIENALADLFEKWCGQKPMLVLPLAPSASPRIYYRLANAERSAIGTYNADLRENQAFITFSKHFHAKGLPVPEIYVSDPASPVYLQEDLGATTLFSYLLQEEKNFPEYLVKIYKKVLEKLVLLQVEGAKGLNFSVCYSRECFDLQSMQWDFNTFKYYFLKIAGLPFNEQALEEDMQRFATYLLSADGNFFMHRDFQARNIMVRKGEPFFIDYQGGRKGALQYDLASLLYQAKANIPEAVRGELLDHYLNSLENLIPVNRPAFIQYFYAYVLMRCIQTFGTYGFRGLIQHKEHFVKSIPFALDNTRWLLGNVAFPVEMPELLRVLAELATLKKFEPFDKSSGTNSLLTVTIQSFSFQRGVPPDNTGHGGGFVFDMRFIHNPGRYEPYKKLTGRDEAVINFLNNHSNMEDFLNRIYRIIDPAVENYIERSFPSLTVNFGCTGGRHRSVYAADQLAKHLQEKYGVTVVVKHLEQTEWG